MTDNLSELLSKMHRECGLSCRIAYASNAQIAVAFYTSVGAQHILTESMEVYGLAYSDDVMTAAERAAEQAREKFAARACMV